MTLSSSFRLQWLSAIVAVVISNLSVLAQATMNCDPCIERPNFYVKAIVHGLASDPYWQQMVASMEQAAKDMRIRFEMDPLAERFDPTKMSEAILSLIPNNEDQSEIRVEIPDALIVTIPNDEVRAAIEKLVAETDIPIFGMNSGYQYAKNLGLKGHIAQDDYVAGQEAAKEFLSIKFPNQWNDTTMTLDMIDNNEDTAVATSSYRALFINHEYGNGGLADRDRGFKDVLKQVLGERVTVDELILNDSQDHAEAITAALQGCQYTAGILAGRQNVEHITSAYYSNECSFESQPLGFFDVDSKVYNAIALGKVAFAISQQQYLQGAATVTLAALYATTGFQLYFPSSESVHGAYLSGPKMIKLQNLPSDSQQICEAEGFPVCNADGTSPNPNGRCPCRDRSTIRLGGSTPHPESTPSHWGMIWEAAQQAAEDAGIDLILDEIERADEQETETDKIAQKYVSLCQSGVDGIFGSGTYDNVVELCSDLQIPFVSVSSALEDRHMHGITMSHYNSAYAASQKLIDAGMQRGYCIQWHLSNDLDDRCFGLRDAIADSGLNITYEGVIYPPEGQTYHDNLALYQRRVLEFIPDEGDWDGIGFLLVSDPFAEGSVLLQDEHPGLLIGAFDSGQKVVQYVEEGRVLYAVDQQPYLQGYLAVRLLAWFAHTKQSLLPHLFESGPQFIEQGPSPELQTCQAAKFDVCPEPVYYNKNQLEQVRPFGLALAGILIWLSLGFIGWTLKNRGVQIVKGSQPFFLITICIGTIIMATAIIPLGLDDGVLREDGGCVDCECPGCDKACMATPWLFTMGFTVVFAALFSKVWRLNKLLESAGRFRRVTISVSDVMIPFAVLLGLNVIFMVVWTVVDPMYFEREQRCGSDEQTSYGSCRIGDTGVSTAMAWSVALVDFCAVLLANIQAYKARHIKTDFSESSYVGIAMLSILQIFMVGTPLVFLVNDNPPAKYFITTAIIAVVCFSVLLVIFIPKIMNSRKPNGPEGGRASSRFSSTKFFPGSARDSFASGLQKSTPMSAEDVWLHQVSGVSGLSQPETSATFVAKPVSMTKDSEGNNAMGTNPSTHESEVQTSNPEDSEDTKES